MIGFVCKVLIFSCLKGLLWVALPCFLADRKKKKLRKVAFLQS